MAMNTRIEAARRQMIEQQVRAWDVLEPRVLDALAALPREHFVPEAYRGVAFADAAIPIGHGQCMLKPAVEGRALQALVVVVERLVQSGIEGVEAVRAIEGQPIDAVMVFDQERLSH